MFDGGDVALRNTDCLCNIRLFGIEASELAYPASDSLPVNDNLFLRFRCRHVYLYTDTVVVYRYCACVAIRSFTFTILHRLNLDRRKGEEHMRLIATWTKDQDVGTELPSSLKWEDGTVATLDDYEKH